jgi:Tol biopolymer transport system component
VAVSALGFTDTVWASVVPTGRVAAETQGAPFIIVTNLDGSAFDTIPGLHAAHSFDWSPVNRTFVMDVDGPEYLLSMDTAGHTRRVVTDALMRSEYYPRFSYDGSYIYFTGNDSLTACYGVWRIHSDGTGLEHVVADTNDCGVYAYTGVPSPDYASSASPDGTRLVYVGGTGIQYVGGTLRVRTFATGADTSLGVVGDAPRWSPTGEWIAYDSLGTLMLIHPNGTSQQALINRGPELYFSNAVSWSPDGQWLVYHTRDRLALVQVATRLKLPLATTIGLADPTWQP